MAQTHMRDFVSSTVKGVAASLSAYLLAVGFVGGPLNFFQTSALFLSSISLPTLLIYIFYEHLDRQGEISDTVFMPPLGALGITSGLLAYTCIVASAIEWAGIVLMFSFVLAMASGYFFIKKPNKPMQPNADAPAD